MLGKAVAFGVLLVYPFGSGNQPTKSAHSSVSVRANSRLRELNTQANAFFQARRYVQAAYMNQQGYAASIVENAPAAACRFLLNLAGCSFALMRYADALNTYLRARDLAESLGDHETAAAASINLSSLHLQMGELDGALEEARRGMALLHRSPRHWLRPRFVFQLAKIKAATEGIDAARPLFAEAIEGADAGGDTRTAAQAWNYRGYLLMEAGRLGEADAAMSNAFRLRKLSAPSDLGSSYRTLVLLRLAQGDPHSAEALSARAMTASTGAPDWMAYYCRGRARMALDRPADALADYRSAIELARRFRLDLVPSDTYRIGADANLDELHSAYVEAAAALYLRTGCLAYAAEAFRATENGRAASLRALVAGAGRYERLAPEYGELLASLRAAETALLAGDDPKAREQARSLRYRMSLIEARAPVAGAEPTDDGELDTRVRHALGPDQALLSFNITGRSTYMWAITRESLEMHMLPGRRELVAAIDEFVRQVRDGLPGNADSRISRLLFGSLSPAVLQKRSWALSLDGDLFAAPLAAALLPDGSRLGEGHALLTVPCAHFLLSGHEAAHSRRFVAVGDAVYNRADPRVHGAIARATGLELPRLAGSAVEIRAAAEAWGDPNPALLEGPEATLASLEAAESKPTAVLHFATHFVTAERDPARANIVLSLKSDGSPELLTPADVAAWFRAPQIVVLSGCDSGRGRIRRGAGLLGMTRAWIAAGAGSVIASLWPEPDSGGELFRHFYIHLRAGDGPAEALRRAQVHAIQSGRVRPRDWAAYITIGKGESVTR